MMSGKIKKKEGTVMSLREFLAASQTPTTSESNQSSDGARQPNDFVFDRSQLPVRLITDESNRLKGHGYVEFANHDSLISALSKTNLAINNRVIKISLDDSHKSNDRSGRENRGPDPLKSDELTSTQQSFFNMNSDEQCSICMEVYNHKTVVPFLVTPCGHTFCQVCLSRLTDKTKCPNCRAHINDQVKNLAVLNLVNNAKNLQETRLVLTEANTLFEIFESTFKRVDTIQSEIKVKFGLIQQFRNKTGTDWNRKLKQPNVKVEHIKQMLVEMKKVTADLRKYESDLSTNKTFNFIPIDGVSLLNHVVSDANKTIENKKETNSIAHFSQQQTCKFRFLFI